MTVTGSSIEPARGARFVCCGVHIDPLSLEESVDRLQTMALSGDGHAVHLCNSYVLSLAARDDDYADVLNGADLNLPDGMPLVWLAHRMGFTVSANERPRGTDVLMRAVETGGSQIKHYLYGSTPDVVDALAARLRSVPGVEIVGVESPPFRALTAGEEDLLVERIRSTGANMVWVGIGTPRQDVFVVRLRDRLPATLVAVGAAFDFLAGSKKEAPRWVQNVGMEWAYRFASEPRRLWKRYLIGNARFMAGVARQGLSLA